MAICAPTQEVLFLRQLITNLNIKPSGPIRMLKDNNRCIALAATNPTTTGKTKHIETRYNFIMELLHNKTVEIGY